MTNWKFEKAKDVPLNEINYIGFVKYHHNKIIQEFYVPESYLKEGKNK